MQDLRPAYMIQTWGCQMNEDDSSQMASLLEQMGYQPTTEESEADIIMLNTCSVRAKPEQKVKSKLGELRILKLERENLIIGVCGCMAQREGKALLNRAPFIDIIMGTASIPELPMLVEQVRRGRGRAVALNMPEKGSNGEAHVKRVAAEVGLKAFVPVMFGCNNYCAYCVVPYARGPERSRPAEDVVSEVSTLVSQGCREVMLVGQNVNSYGNTTDGVMGRRGDGGTHALTDHESRITPNHDFAELLTTVNEIPDLIRIRFITSHPKDLNDRLIDAISTLPKVCEHVHLPIQAGDDEILRRMGRGYTFEHYLSLAAKLRERVQGLALTTDIMIGFPGETEEQFQKTMKAVETVRWDAAFMFAYSARPGTAAARMEGQIDSTTKRRRLSELMDLQNEITFQNARASEGKILEVLVEGTSDKNQSMLTGYTRTNRTVNFPGDAHLIGKLVRVRATKAHPWGFTGEIENP